MRHVVFLYALIAFVQPSAAELRGTRPMARADTDLDAAVDLGITYTFDVWSNLAGGIQQDSVYLDNLDVLVDIDAEALFGARNTRLFLYGLYNNGGRFSDNVVGDLQVASNIETGVRALRLFEAWVNVDVGPSGSIRAGLYDLNSEFDVLDASQLFVGSAHGIGTDIGQTGVNGPSIFPVTSLALRLAGAWTDSWSYRLALLDGVPGIPDDPRDTTIRLSEDDGALVIGELARDTDASRLLLGAWTYTADFDRDPLLPDESASRRGNGNAGFYVRGQTLLRDGSDTLAAFFRVGTANGHFNVFSRFISAGINWRGFHRTRADDRLGIAFAWAESSRVVRDAAADLRQAPPGREIAVELTYRASLGERLTLQPNLQYIVNPGLDPELDDALLLGIRFELALWSGRVARSNPAMLIPQRLRGGADIG